MNCSCRTTAVEKIVSYIDEMKLFRLGNLEHMFGEIPPLRTDLQSAAAFWQPSDDGFPIRQ